MAQQMRAIVREQLQAGKSPDEIKDFFVSKYGEWVLLKPKTTGFSALLWILPYVVLVLGVSAALWFVRRWAARKKTRSKARLRRRFLNKSALSFCVKMSKSLILKTRAPKPNCCASAPGCAMN